MNAAGIRNLRKELRAIEQALTDYPSGPPPATLSVAKARMWLGEALAAAGQSNPYPDSMDPDSEEIAPSADLPDEYPEKYGWRLDDATIIRVVKQIRLDLSEIEETVRFSIKYQTGGKSPLRNHPDKMAYTHIVEARMLCGELLAELAGDSDQ